MSARPHPAIPIAFGALGVVVGLALIFANIAFGKAVIIASTVGAALAWVRRRD